jgi:predicted nucleic acid-binding protein
VDDDPTDDMFINAAIVGKASYIITGDERLLLIKQIGQIKIMNIRTFIYANLF